MSVMEHEPIYVTYDEMHADRIRGILAGAGIPCVARSMRIGGYEGIRVGPLGEIHLLVPRPYAAKALRLIREAVRDGALWPLGAPYTPSPGAARASRDDLAAGNP